MNRTAVERFILENFAGIAQDWPWEDSPEYSVFRHTENKKWFALLMTVKQGTLSRQNPGRFPADADPDLPVNILNLKSDPDLIEDVIHTPGVLSAYHMNKRHWITVLLDGSCDEDKIRNLIDLSYQLTAKHNKS